MSKRIFLVVIALITLFNVNNAKDNTIYGEVVSQFNPTISLQTVNIPAGTFTMGSSQKNELKRDYDEEQYQVTLNAFKMSKYEVTNEEYAEFLNVKNIGSDGKYVAGSYPTQTLIYASSGTNDWGLHYEGSKWVPVKGFEKNPVIYVTWYGATEFAKYAGGSLPTEAQWEYACRANTTTPFNTGECLSEAQANFVWVCPVPEVEESYKYKHCKITNKNYPEKTQPVGTYPANAFGLFDMHGNVWEWCADWYGYYPTTAQINPTGFENGYTRVCRGGSWNNIAIVCRSANRYNCYSSDKFNCIGFRLVFPQ